MEMEGDSLWTLNREQLKEVHVTEKHNKNSNPSFCPLFIHPDNHVTQKTAIKEATKDNHKC